MKTLLDSDFRGGSQPPWLPRILPALIADFRNLPVRMQSELLESRWDTIKGPAMIPVLRVLYENSTIEDVALRRLFELAPEEARQDLLSELLTPAKNLHWSTLTLLPDGPLPEMDGIFAARAEAHNVDERLIVRYATGGIVKRVEKAYGERNAELARQKLTHCMSPLVFYFLQYDPAFGEGELRRNLSATSGFPGCYDLGFQFLSLGRYAMSPALERLAIEFLGSPVVPIKRGAAEILGKYGTVAAREPLWKTMEFFRSWWKGREEELLLPSGQEGLQFERALRIALGQADGWKLNGAELGRLHGLCSSEWCKRDLAEWLGY